MLDFEKGICAYKYCAMNIIYMQNLEDEKSFSLGMFQKTVYTSEI